MPQERGIVVKVESHFAPDLPRVLGAESEVRDALTNLMLNAVDALPKAASSISARATTRATTACWWKSMTTAWA